MLTIQDDVDRPLENHDKRIERSGLFTEPLPPVERKQRDSSGRPVNEGLAGDRPWLHGHEVRQPALCCMEFACPHGPAHRKMV